MTDQVEIDTILTCTSSMALRSDLTAEQRAEAIRIGRIGFASAGAKRKPKEAIAAQGSHLRPAARRRRLFQRRV